MPDSLPEVRRLNGTGVDKVASKKQKGYGCGSVARFTRANCIVSSFHFISLPIAEMKFISFQRRFVEMKRNEMQFIEMHAGWGE